MADEDDLDDDLEEDFDGDEEDDEGEGLPSGWGGNKKNLFILIGAVLLLVVSGIGAAYFMNKLDGVVAMVVGGEGGREGDESEIIENAIFLDVEKITVNLNTGERKSPLLRIGVSLVIENPEDVPRVEAMMPMVIDNFQVYLRELRVEDLKGSAGIYRLREELLIRVNAAVSPAEVRDVLFKEMLVR